MIGPSCTGCLLAAVAAGALLSAATSSEAQSVSASVARGDAAWAGRAQGADGPRAGVEPILESVRAYEEGVGADPGDWTARWKLLRSLHFAGTFAVEDIEEQKALFEQATRSAEASLDLLARRTNTGERLDRIELVALRSRAAEAGVPPTDVARLYFWAAINWGAWSQNVGLLGAVREGVANRLNRYVAVTLELEPAYDEGGAYRLLGRLHAALPRVPFLSGWVDRDEALPLIERGLALAPRNPGNRLLLALTLLDLAPGRRDEALGLLSEVATLEPRRTMVVEDLSMREEARERLKDLDRGPET